MCFFLNSLVMPEFLTSRVRGPNFPLPKEDSGRPLPEDFLMRGQSISTIQRDNARRRRAFNRSSIKRRNSHRKDIVAGTPYSFSQYDFPASSRFQLTFTRQKLIISCSLMKVFNNLHQKTLGGSTQTAQNDEIAGDAGVDGYIIQVIKPM